MRKSNHAAIRAALSGTDGKTVIELQKLTGVRSSAIREALPAMPDAYIDRWGDKVRGQRPAVWCVVHVPANCPHPDEPGL